MVTLAEFQREADILDEIARQSDRGAAILAVAFLEEGLAGC